MRVVIAHDFAETFGGAERIAATIAECFPQAPFGVILGRREVGQRMGLGDRFFSLLPERQRLLRHYRLLAPVYPLLVRRRSLPAADVLVTSSYAFAHGFRTQNDAPQLCYCYSPLRFAWSMTEAYGDALPGGRASGATLRLVAGGMRAADRRAARRVTRYVAESHHVAAQIRRFYGREADVLHPPVDCELFRPGPGGHDGYFLFCGRLVEAYKRPSLVVRAFGSLPGRLIVAGEGPALGHLKSIAGPNVEFVQPASDRELVGLMQRCAALIFPSRDDFGLVPVEAMACGRPVLAYAEGGALETVVPGRTGELFGEQSVEAVRAAVAAFDPRAYDPEAIRAHAEGWRPERFRAGLTALVRETAGME